MYYSYRPITTLWQINLLSKITSLFEIAEFFVRFEQFAVHEGVAFFY